MSSVPLLVRPKGYRHNPPVEMRCELSRMQHFSAANGIVVAWSRIPHRKSKSVRVTFRSPARVVLAEVTGWDILVECVESGVQRMARVATCVAHNNVEAWVAHGLLSTPHIRLTAHWLREGC